MMFRQFGLVSYSGGAHAPPSLQPCPSFTSCTTQQPVVFNTAPPSREHACVHPRSPSVSLFFRQPLAGWPSHGTPTPTPTPCEWNAIFFFPLWATHRALVAHCHPPPPPVTLVSPPYVPLSSTYDGLPAQDRNPPRQYPQIICHCPRAWSMGRPLL